MLLENQRFTETITLSPKKANSKYNVLRRAFATFAFHGMLLTMLVCPIKRTYGA
ncbi:hypothetical protein [Helicobacter pylori]|uniref:hypothetical protein n=1 Tax=Helicobacter pylori TaxID=210 RepID=UPI002927F550|nr:hypothetical protein [Helicobacter pylori]MDU9703503.1 hypothetical protein [Helicobacter pylori]